MSYIHLPVSFFNLVIHSLLTYFFLICLLKQRKVFPHIILTCSTKDCVWHHFPTNTICKCFGGIAWILQIALFNLTITIDRLTPRSYSLLSDCSCLCSSDICVASIFLFCYTRTLMLSPRLCAPVS